MIRIPEPVVKALNMLESAGYEGYIVGGCVRDSIMETNPHDYDVTTSAMPEEVKTVFEGFPVIETGIKHGTVTLLMGNQQIEITTFRTEGEYLDGRHPSCVSFTKSLKEDLARRDFTINAVAMDVRGRIYDYFGGEDDIKAGVIRAVGSPRERFEEDALRIMRALRFASAFGFEIEEETAQSARLCREMLYKVSGERLRVELSKLLLGKDVSNILLKYWDILSVIIPELEKMHGFDQKNPYHIYDVLEHTAIAVENMPKSEHLRLAALFHDIGKTETFSIDDKGIGHFYGHASASVDMARQIMNHLKFDNETKGKVLELVKYHDVLIEANYKSVRRALNKYTKEGFFDLIALKKADNLAQNPDLSFRCEELLRLEEIAREIIQEEQCFSLKDLAVKGGDLIEAGMKPGKELGDMLKLLLEAVIDEEVANDKEKLLEFAKKI